VDEVVGHLGVAGVVQKVMTADTGYQVCPPAFCFAAAEIVSHLLERAADDGQSIMTMRDGLAAAVENPDKPRGTFDDSGEAVTGHQGDRLAGLSKDDGVTRGNRSVRRVVWVFTDDPAPDLVCNWRKVQTAEVLTAMPESFKNTRCSFVDEKGVVLPPRNRLTAQDSGSRFTGVNVGWDHVPYSRVVPGRMVREYED